MDVWTYSQSTGVLTLNGEHLETCYSGNGEGRNNGKFQFRRNVGPIPRGVWLVLGVQETPTPHSLRVSYKHGKGTMGRSGFLVHGAKRDGTPSSQGCIICSRDTRKLMKPGSLLTVIP